MNKEMKWSLAAARVNKGLTLKEVSDITGLSKDTVYKVESGKSDPRYSTLCKLCRLYEVGLDDIFIPSSTA